MKATRPNRGYIFHGGCDGCTNKLEVCPTCRYMEPNWNLPDMNPVHIEEVKEKQKMKDLAYSLIKKTTK